MKKNYIVSLILASCFSNAALATLTPQPYPEDARILRVAYQNNNVIPIKGQTFTSTQVVFGVHERILNVDGGDRDGWMVT